MPFDWHQFHLSEERPAAVVDPRRRLRICLGGFLLLAVMVLGRAAQLEVTQGDAFRAEAAQPLERRHSLPGVRGRILAHDGTVLAYDKKILALAVQYRYLQQPPDPRWLRAAARARLPKVQRRDAQSLAAAEDQLRSERADLARRLAGLCSLSDVQWEQRARRIQARVERIAEGVNCRRLAEAAAPTEDPPAEVSTSFFASLARWIEDSVRASLDEATPPRIAVAEESDYHVMAEDLPLGVVAQIEGYPQEYPGVKIVERTRRCYPAGRLAAHVLGHLGAVSEEDLPRGAGDDQSAYRADDYVGRTGVERQYESVLRGRPGAVVELSDHSGRVLASSLERKPGLGCDLVLTLDSQLQRAAEELLDSALERRALLAEANEPAGGAIVVIDVRTGALRAVAAAPRFDPNGFVAGNKEELAAVLDDPAAPLLDRATRMAIAPGSIFKVVAAIALLESGAVDPEESLTCQGYLHQPDRQRCEIYVRHGVGHGQVALGDALAQSCNVYFFDRSGRMGPEPLVDWARRLGFGRPTGIDLPGEAAGTLPTPETIGGLEGHAWRVGDTQSLAIGQGSLTATPLQIVRLMAAVANGGQLLIPRVLENRCQTPFSPVEDPTDESWPEKKVPDAISLRPKTLATVRDGLRRVVADPEGTAHGTVYLDAMAVAGKTGTAETGGGRAAHAWFAGYVPAERPKLAFVVVLEHAGSGATAAGPVAQRLVLRMQELGML